MRTTITANILLLMIIETVNTKQLTCSSERTFIATEGYILSGHTFSTQQVSSYPFCHKLCSEHPRCLSYNYQVSSPSSSHVCEINDATAKMCPHDMVKTTGYKYYEDKDATCGWQCPPRDVEGTNFQLTFPRRSVEDYVRFDLQRCAPPLIAFTVCLWLKVAHDGRSDTLFSYTIPNEDNEIVLRNYMDLKFFIAGEKRRMNTAVKNGTWRHVCTTWENTAGSYNLYIDGTLIVNGDNLKTGHVIENNGIFILGQDQDSYGGEFQWYQSFFGQMYGMNMWNRVLTAEEILHLSESCSYGVGNYLRWSDFVTGLHGNVRKTSPATCLP
ncbi:hypothetical protein ACROYT_G032816 [Oculina patagonica]